MSAYDETTLLARAREILGEGEEVLAAGIFGLAELSGAAAIGMVAGNTAADLIPGGDSILGSLIGTLLGRRAAIKATAEQHGATVQLLVAVTPDTIHVLNADTQGRLDPELTSFPRATTDVTVKTFGASRHLTFTDGDHVLKLHGTGAGISPLVAGDKLVMDLLAEPKPVS
ncbi:hypothetical protein [Microbacterium sp. GXF7504]